MNKFTLAGCFNLLCLGTLSAQGFPVSLLNLGGGFTQTVGDTGRYLNAGLGIAMATQWHGKIFAEAPYVHAFAGSGVISRASNNHGENRPVSRGFAPGELPGH